MSYTAVFCVNLGASNTEKTLAGQVVGLNGVNSGSAITGWQESASFPGVYSKEATLTDGQKGTLIVYDTAAPTVVLGMYSLAPNELEDATDTKTAIDSFLSMSYNGTITVSGSDDSVNDGVYHPSGIYNSRPYWKTGGESIYYIWYDTLEWVISTARGTTGDDYYTLSGNSPIGTWTPVGEYVATPATTGYPGAAATALAASAPGAKSSAESAVTNTASLPGMITAGAFTEEAMGNVRSALGMASANLDTQLTVYFADIRLNRDSARQRDEYNIQWFKNGSPATLVEAGAITTPKITVISRAGVTLVSAQTLTEVGSGLGSYKYDATGTSRAASSDAVLVTVSATIGGSIRSFAKWVY